MVFVCTAQPELASPKARLATEGDWLQKIRLLCHPVMFLHGIPPFAHHESGSFDGGPLMVNVFCSFQRSTSLSKRVAVLCPPAAGSNATWRGLRQPCVRHAFLRAASYSTLSNLQPAITNPSLFFSLTTCILELGTNGRNRRTENG